MKSSISEIATRIGRALVSASSSSSSSQAPSRALTWTPRLEQTLHCHLIPSQLTPRLVAAVIDPYLLSHHSIAVGFFNWATQQPNFAHDSLSYRSIIKSLCSSRHFSTIDRILKQARSQNVVLDSSAYGLVIGLYVRNKRTHIARLVFDEVRRLNLGVGADVYNLLLAGLASEGQMANALKLLDEMLERGICCSTLGFGVLLWNFIVEAELDTVFRMIDEVRKDPISTTINGSIVAVLVVHGLCRASRYMDASQALDELRVRGWKPDFVAYRVVAEACRESGDVAARERILKKKRKLGVAPRAREYGEFILSLISERFICEANELGLVLVNGSFPVDEDVMNTLIGTVSGLYPSAALDFFEFMMNGGNYPTALTLTNLSRNLCKNGRTDELLRVYRTLDSKGYFTDSDSYGLMVSFLCLSGRVKEAYEVLKEMKKKGLSPTVGMYNSIMEACCRDDLIRPAKRLWDEMFSSGCQGNLKTYSLLIGKLSEIGELEEAQRLFRHMLEKELVPDSPIYTSLIEGLCRETKFDAALEIFQRLIEQDASLAKSVSDTFVTHLCEGGQFAAASRVLRCGSCHADNVEAHVRFLKCLADERELEIAIGHIAWVQETAPSMLQHVFSELAAPLSSSTSRPAAMQDLFTAIQENRMIL